MPNTQTRFAGMRTYYQLRPLLVKMVSALSPAVLLDAGCGNGVITQQMAKDLAVQRALFIDSKNSIVIPLEKDWHFFLTDICDPGFLSQFQDKASVVVSILAFHEFDDPSAAALNLMGILPEGGRALIVDRTEAGWSGAATMAAADGAEAVEHYYEDLRRLEKSGLRTDEGIRHFWEKKLLPSLPGQGRLIFSGDAYQVLYVAS